jgi:hypothetical protein
MRPSRLFALSFAVGVGALAGCGEGTGAAQSSAAISATAVHPENPGRKKFLTAMTRNLYIGADLFAPFQSEDPLGAAEQVWAEILASSFAARAGAIADEIVGASPDVVGLQEVYRFIVTPLGAAEPVLQDLDRHRKLGRVARPGDRAADFKPRAQAIQRLALLER